MKTIARKLLFALEVTIIGAMVLWGYISMGITAFNWVAGLL